TVLHPRERDSGESSDGRRTAGSVLFNDLPLLQEVKRAPVGVVQHALWIVGRPPRIALDIRLELRRILEYLVQLGANVRRRGLDAIEPREVVPVVELNLRQLRK